MLESVRVRLTLWYAGVLAVVLVVLALATYFILRQNTAQRADSSLAELADAFLTTLQAEMKDESGPGALKRAAFEAITEHRFRDHFYAVLESTGVLIASSRDLPAANPPSSREDSSRIFDSHSFRRLVESSSRADGFFQNVRGGGEGYRGFVRHFGMSGQTYTLIVLQSLHPQEAMLEEVVQTFSLVIPIAVLLASAGGYFLARKSLAPVVAMSTQAEHIGAATLHERLPVQNEKDELGHLARSFNQLLDRLDQFQYRLPCPHGCNPDFGVFAIFTTSNLLFLVNLKLILVNLHEFFNSISMATIGKRKMKQFWLFGRIGKFFLAILSLFIRSNDIQDLNDIIQIKHFNQNKKR